jgi:hypothetical protein
MKRIIITVAALLVAVVPATVGLWGNASFSQAVPVRVPASGQVVTPTAPNPSATTADDHGGDTPRDQRTEPGDDRSATSTSTPSGTRTTGADDHGGDTPRDQRTEPGDDRGSGSGRSGSGSGHNSGSGSSGSGSGSSGHSGSDDSGSDDHGGHGSDD